MVDNININNNNNMILIINKPLGIKHEGRCLKNDSGLADLFLIACDRAARHVAVSHNALYCQTFDYCTK